MTKGTAAGILDAKMLTYVPTSGVMVLTLTQSALARKPSPGNAHVPLKH